MTKPAFTLTCYKQGSSIFANMFEDDTALLSHSGDAFLGKQIGPYSLEKLLGSGGMGSVYLAHDARLERKVALKLLEPSMTSNSQWRSRFLREARLASSLDHPNICTIHEVGEAANQLFIAMQYVEGQTLRQLINGRPLSLEQLLHIAQQVAEALAAAHDRAIIHRDIKSGNIMVTTRGQVKVLDFGLAKLDREDGDAHLTQTGVVMGTPASMSPEQARGEQVDHRSDVFSFGVLLYEMATGQSPFPGRSSADMISALLKDPHAPVSKVNKEIPAELSALIDKALCKDPAQRYQSMEEIVSDLRRLNSTRAENAERSGKRDFFPRVILVAGVILAAIAALTLIYYRSQSTSSTPGQTTSSAVTPIKSIAVLPFKPLVADNRNEALELGMADTLIAKFGSLKQINVRPITAVRKYVGLDQDAVAAGREQMVDAVLDGSIQKAGDRIRVTVRLVRVGDSFLMWTDQFDVQVHDFFQVQDSISERVVSELAMQLSGDEKGLLTKRQTENMEAYRLYLLGRYHMNRLTDDGFRSALDHFRQSIQIDPNYAPAYAGMADAYNSLAGFNASPPKESYPLAKKAAMQALKLDETLAEAHAALALVTFFYDWSWSDAESEFKRAIALNPSNADAHQTYGYFLAARGRFDEALSESQRALELDPVSVVKIMGRGEILHFSRRDTEAIESYKQTVIMDPNFGFTYWALGRAYLAKDMYEEAIAAFKKSIPLSGDSPDEPAELARAYALSGRKAEARKIINELKEQSRKRYISPTVIAFIHAALGEKDEAFNLLEQAYDDRDFVLVLAKIEPAFDPLRSDPRFAALLKRVGLEQP
jgi:serine/threonine-protein kinase